MLETIKGISIVLTAVGIGATAYLQAEKFRMDGEWIIHTCTTETEFANYKDLHLAWRVFMSDDPLGAPVVGDGEKVLEAFSEIPPRGRFPVRLVGTKEINRVTLTARFEGANRASTGRFELKPVRAPRKWSGYLPFYQRNMMEMEGTFAFTAGNARGHARAILLVDGKMPADTTPFACGGITAPPPVLDTPISTPDASEALPPSDEPL